MEAIILVVWLALCGGIAALANSRGRSGIAYFFFAFLLSPLLVFILLLCAKDLKAEAARESQRRELEARDREHKTQLETIKTLVKPIPAPTAQTAPANRSVADELTNLAGLRDTGVLTEEEFTRQKGVLLGMG